MGRKPPLAPDRDDVFAPDYKLDHALWAGFSPRPGYELAQEEAIIDLRDIFCSSVGGCDMLGDDGLDEAMVEGEAWFDLEGSWLEK